MPLLSIMLSSLMQSIPHPEIKGRILSSANKNLMKDNHFNSGMCKWEFSKDKVSPHEFTVETISSLLLLIMYCSFALYLKGKFKFMVVTLTWDLLKLPLLNIYKFDLHNNNIMALVVILLFTLKSDDGVITILFIHEFYGNISLDRRKRNKYITSHSIY